MAAALRKQQSRMKTTGNSCVSKTTRARSKGGRGGEIRQRIYFYHTNTLCWFKSDVAPPVIGGTSEGSFSDCFVILLILWEKCRYNKVSTQSSSQSSVLKLASPSTSSFSCAKKEKHPPLNECRVHLQYLSMKIIQIPGTLHAVGR